MFILKDAAKDLYITMVRSDVTIDMCNRSAIRTDAAARKLFVYAYSLPFWAGVETVLSEDGFDQLLEFTEAMDQVVVPESMFAKLNNAYRHALLKAQEKDFDCVRRK